MATRSPLRMPMPRRAAAIDVVVEAVVGEVGGGAGEPAEGGWLPVEHAVPAAEPGELLGGSGPQAVGIFQRLPLQRLYRRVEDLHPTTSSERVGAGGAGARRQRYLSPARAGNRRAGGPWRGWWEGPAGGLAPGPQAGMNWCRTVSRPARASSDAIPPMIRPKNSRSLLGIM